MEQNKIVINMKQIGMMLANCLLMLTLLLGLMSAMRLTTLAAENGLYVNNVYANTTNSDTGWSYDADTNTLTLNNYSFSGLGSAPPSDSTVIMYYPTDRTLTIELKGTNTIVQGYNTNNTNITLWGIYSNSDLVITGDGTLNISTTDGAYRGAAIYCEKNVTIEGTCTVNATSGTVTGDEQGHGIGGGGFSTLTIGENANVTLKGPKGGANFVLADSALAARVQDGGTTTEYTNFTTALTSWGTATNATLTLLADATTESTISVSPGIKTLDLNDHSITYTGSGNGAIILDGGETLSICDNGTTERYYKINQSTHRGEIVSEADDADGSFIGGYITAGSSRGFYVYPAANTTAELIMNGGTVFACNANVGSGIYSFGTFRMTGGSFIGNYSEGHQQWGGTVYNAGTMEISGGVIRHNYSNRGAGLFQEIYSNSSGSISGGRIIDNNATENGGGVFLNYNEPTNPKFIISGNPEISGNKLESSDNNIYLTDGTSQYVSIGGELSNTISIGISMESLGVFTNSTNTDYNDASKFTSDKTDYILRKNGDGQLELALPLELANNGYPWGSAMNDSSVTLNIAAATDTPSSYQWESKADGGTMFVNVSGGTGSNTAQYTPGSFVDGTWYRCKVDDTYSEAVQIIKPERDINTWEYKDKYDRIWTRPYSGTPWYISNGTMAYTIDSTNKRFDIVGSFTKNGKTYMLQTSYGGGGWQMYTSVAAMQSALDNYYSVSASLDAVRFAFGDNPYVLDIEADLYTGHQAFSFGCDTQLGNYATSGSYSDYAALVADRNGDNTLKQIVMIGAETKASATADDPAFVIAPIGPDTARAGNASNKPFYWLGAYYGRNPFGINEGADSWGDKASGLIKADGLDATGIISAQKLDSGMTMSWYNVPSGGKVKFRFSVGDAQSTGAVSGAVNYSTETIDALEASTDYDITVDNTTYIVTSTADGSIPLSGKAKDGTTDYDFIEKSISIAKNGSSDTSLNLTIASRPTAYLDAPVVNDSAVFKPIEVRMIESAVTKDSVTIKVDPTDYSDEGRAKMTQKYRICASNGAEIEGYDWIAPNSRGEVVFAGLAAGTEYSLQARLAATSTAPKSEIKAVTVKTAADITITEAEDKTVARDTGAGITVNNGATVSYSTALDEAYIDTVPSFNKGGKYTVYYCVQKTGSVTIYGNYDVTVDPIVTFNANGGTLTDVATRMVTYGNTINNNTTAIADPTKSSVPSTFAGWYSDEALTNRVDPATTKITEDMTLYAWWAQSLSSFGFSDEFVKTVTSVQLFKGSIPICAEQTIIPAGSGSFNLSNIPDGIYNMVFKRTDKATITVLVEVTNNIVRIKTNGGTIQIPDDTKLINSLTTVEDGAPSVVVGNLDAEAAKQDGSNYIYWDAEFDVKKKDNNGHDIASTTKVDLTFTAAPEEDYASLNLSTAQEKGLTQEERDLRSGQQNMKNMSGVKGDSLIFLDFSIKRTVWQKVGTETNFTSLGVTDIHQTEHVLAIIVPYDTSGKTPCVVHRKSNGALEKFTQVYTETGGTHGQFYVGNGYLVIFTNEFSLYAIGEADNSGGYDPPTPPTPTYRPTITQPEHGTISVVPTLPRSGQNVVITVTPEEGYETEEVIVKDKNGNTVPVTKNPDGTYSFTQPSTGAVTIEAVVTPKKDRTPIINEPEHGTVVVSPENPGPNDIVTITVTPEEGYEVDSVVVTDKDGNPVAVTKNPDGTYSFTQPASGSVTITPVLRLKDGVIITFDLNGKTGTAPEAQTVRKGEKAVKPKNPVAEGYSFKGWFTDKECETAYDFNTPVNEDLTLYAGWKTKEEPGEDDFGIYFVELFDDPYDGVSYNAELDRYEIVYTGAAINPLIRVSSKADGDLKEGIDYSVSYSNNKNVSKPNKPATIKVSGKGFYKSNKVLELYILQANLEEAMDKGLIAGADELKVLSGQKLNPVLVYRGYKLTSKDRDISNKNKITADTTTDITGKGNFTGTLKDVSVKVLSKAEQKKNAIKVNLKAETHVYNGEAVELKVTTADAAGELTVTAGSSKTPLAKDTDFLVSYSRNISAGKATVTIKGFGSYNGTVVKHFTIQPDKAVDITTQTSDPDKPIYYNVRGAMPGITVTAHRSTDEILKEGRDYLVSYSSNKKVGKGSYSVKFIGNYKGHKAVKGTFDIVQAPMDTAKVEATQMIYKKPGKYLPKPYVSIDGVQLKTSDYTYKYYLGEEEITAKSKLSLAEGETSKTVRIVVTGKGNYTNTTAEGTYEVVRRGAGSIDLTKAKIVAKDKKNGKDVSVAKQEYTGYEIEPEIRVMVKVNKKWVDVDPADYTVSYINNVNKGMATILLTGDGEKVVGSKTARFSISTMRFDVFKLIFG